MLIHYHNSLLLFIRWLSFRGSTSTRAPCTLPLPILLPSIHRPCTRHLSGHAAVCLAVHLSLCPSTSVTLPTSVCLMPNCLHYSLLSLQHLFIHLACPPSACPGASLGLKGTFRGHCFPVQVLSQAFSRVSSLSSAALSAAKQKQQITLLWSSPKDLVMDYRAHLPPG